MKKVTDFIVEKRYLILGIFMVMTISSLLVMHKVHINYDMTEYLPEDSEVKMGMNIMDEEFEEEESSSFNIMFKDLSQKEKKEILNALKNTINVSSVDYDETSNYNKDEFTLYIVHVNAKDDSSISKDVYQNILEEYKDFEIATSGDIADRNKDVLPAWIMVLAISCALIILIVMCTSYVEPFLFLFSIGIAVFLNKGTNIFFSSVSNITDSIVAILQMALSMDYSIMLMNRYSQEKEHEKNKVKAMKEALYKSFGSISSSSITTIVGLLTLVFMSFTIGRDLGIILAKGVLLSLLSIFFVLPGLILIFDKAIEKTKKKSFNISLNKLGKISYHFRYIVLILFIGIFAFSYFLKGNLSILYTDKESDEIEEIFKENNQMAIIYNNRYEDEVSSYCRNLEANEKIDNVLCFGNTINEELTYSNLNSKINSLGQSLEIDESILKILYYNYYHKNEEKMTFNEFIDSINDFLNKNNDIKLDKDIQNSILKLQNFVDENSILEEKSFKEISNILKIEEEKVKDLFLLYHSKNISNKMTLKEFISFINNVVLKDEKYANNFSKEQITSLNRLKPFTDKNLIQKKYNYEQMANLFGISKDSVKGLYDYYISLNEIDTELTLHEFTSYLLNDVMNSSYASSIDLDMYHKIQLLNTISDKAFIQQQKESNIISQLFSIDENSVKKIMLLKYQNIPSETKLSLQDFIVNVTNIKNSTDLLDSLDVSSLIKLYPFAKNESNFNNTSFSKETLSTIFNSNLVDMVYMSLDDSITMTPKEFVDFVIQNMSSSLDQQSINSFYLMKKVMEDTTFYSSSELSNLLQYNEEDINRLYVLIDYISGNTSSWTISPYEFISLAASNLSNPNLQVLKTILDSSLSDTTYTYLELSNLLSMDENIIKQLYTLYTINHQDLTLTPISFVSFIIDHKEDEALKNNVSSMVNELTLIQKVMNGTFNDKKYSSLELSNLLDISKSNVDLLYSLYDLKEDSISISLYDFTKFIKEDIMNHPSYKNNFSEETKKQLTTIYGIMESSLNHVSYTSLELTNIINNLSNHIDNNMIELIFMYYGSENYYNDSWTMTIKTFTDYLNQDILSDKRFDSFIDEKMSKNIMDSKNSIEKAEKMLVGKNYSRVIINTKLDYEGDETFEFIKQIEEDLEKIGDDFYLIGDSPMAFDMSKSFQGELNFITILTMIAIFIVVAVTFKSLLIPLILVLIIQCAVYLTMGILSLMGGDVYFISILIVQSILMGATIDYAILYTSYYRESRETMDVKESLINAYNKSIHTILTSASILIIVTFIVGCFATQIAAKICRTLSQGTLCSALLILLVLPAILASLDKFIKKQK